MEVLKLDVWTWLHGNDPGFTFQSAQHRQTWSRLDRMYVMHNHGIDMYKSLLGKPPLRFNSSLSLQPHFDSLMEQILVNF